VENIWDLFQMKDSSLWSLINFFGRVERKGDQTLSQVLLWKDTVWMGMLFGNQKKQGDSTQLFPMQKPITSSSGLRGPETCKNSCELYKDGKV